MDHYLAANKARLAQAIETLLDEWFTDIDVPWRWFEDFDSMQRVVVLGADRVHFEYLEIFCRKLGDLDVMVHVEIGVWQGELALFF